MSAVLTPGLLSWWRLLTKTPWTAAWSWWLQIDTWTMSADAQRSATRTACQRSQLSCTLRTNGIDAHSWHSNEGTARPAKAATCRCRPFGSTALCGPVLLGMVVDGSRPPFRELALEGVLPSSGAPFRVPGGAIQIRAPAGREAAKPPTQEQMELIKARRADSPLSTKCV